jgi:hypothetical protein
MSTIPWDTLSEFQSDMLADGRVTAGEYDAAALAFIGCGREAGYEYVGSETPNMRGRYNFIFRGSKTSSGSLEDQHRSIAECRAEYLDAVELFWARHTAPSEEELQDARRAFAACLNDRGLTVPEDPSPGQMAELLIGPDGRFPSAMRDCQSLIEEQFGLSGFIG